MPVKAGVIGVGYLGQHHARIYSGMDSADLVGVFDTDTGRCNEIAEQYGCKPFTDMSELISNCDALSIVAPTQAHHDIAMECIEQGKDILVEKPITVTVEEADHIISEAHKRDLILQVGHLERFNPAVLAVHQYLTEPQFFESERLSPFLERAAGIDVTLDLMIHDIDIILSLARSEPKRVSAVGTSVMSDNIDVAKAWIDFDNGVSALISAGRLSQGKSRKLKIFQRDSHLVIDYQEGMIKRHYKTGSNKIMHDVIKPDDREPLLEELISFVQCIETRERPVVSGEEARNALKVALQITEQLKGSN